MTEQKRRDAISGGLRAERNRRKLTQEQVGEAISRNQSTINAWERTGAISLENAWRLADLYGVSLDSLAGRATA